MLVLRLEVIKQSILVVPFEVFALALLLLDPPFVEWIRCLGTIPGDAWCTAGPQLPPSSPSLPFPTAPCPSSGCPPSRLLLLARTLCSGTCSPGRHWNAMISSSPAAPPPSLRATARQRSPRSDQSFHPSSPFHFARHTS